MLGDVLNKTVVYTSSGIVVLIQITVSTVACMYVGRVTNLIIYRAS